MLNLKEILIKTKKVCNMYVVYLFLYFGYLVSADPDIGEIDGK